MGTPACAGLLAVAGTLRPEAWGLAVHQRRARLAQGARSPTRVLSVVSAVVPPALWVTLDHAFTGDWWWSSNIVDAYNDRFHPPLLHLSRPARGGHRARRRRVDLAGRAARARRARRSASSSGRSTRASSSRWRSWWRCVVVVARGQISADDVGRMLTALAVFAAAGAAVALAAHNAGMLRGSLAVVAVAAVPLAAAPWLAGAVHDVRDQSRQARALGSTSWRRRSSARRRRATSRCRASGRASSRSPGTARAARSSRRARSATEWMRRQVRRRRARSCPRTAGCPRWIREVVVTHDWRAGVRARPCTH